MENAAQNCRAGKCETGKCGTKMQDVKMQEMKIRHKKSWAGKCETSQYDRGGATPGPSRSYALPLKNWDLALGPA